MKLVIEKLKFHGGMWHAACVLGLGWSGEAS